MKYKKIIPIKSKMQKILEYHGHLGGMSVTMTFNYATGSYLYF